MTSTPAATIRKSLLAPVTDTRASPPDTVSARPDTTSIVTGCAAWPAIGMSSEAMSAPPVARTPIATGPVLELFIESSVDVFVTGRSVVATALPTE